METMVLTAQRREVHGSRRVRRLRQQGWIPAVVYGHKEPTISLMVRRDNIQAAIRHGVRIVDLQTDGRTEKALIRDVQWDYLGMEVLHVDFARVAAGERIVLEVRLELRGTPVGLSQGGVLDQQLHTLKVECPALSPPDAIRVNLSDLQLGQVLYVRDLKLPEGVRALTDPETVVVHITQKVTEEAAAAAPTAPSATEPEVIGRKAAAEEKEGAEE
jgi:large subunit ribosomal protein L25